MRRRTVAGLSLLGAGAALVALRLGPYAGVPWSSTPARQVKAGAKRALPGKAPVAGPRVVLIRKKERVLALYLNGKPTAAYPIALNDARSEGHKEWEGDRRTPEGEYYICTRNPRSQYHLFVGISYPNARDAEAAYAAGRITAEDRDAIVAAIAKRQRPPWGTPLGGEVGIHGGGVERDWTIGCIALEDAAIDELWRTLKLGDPVIIEP